MDDYFPDIIKFVGKTRGFISGGGGGGGGGYQQRGISIKEDTVRTFTADNADEESEKAL